MFYVFKLLPNICPALLSIIHTFRESIYMNSAEESFKTGWSEIQKGQYESISKLWDGVAR